MPSAKHGKRRYESAKRARAAARTRQRIIDAAHGLLERDDGNVLALQEIAVAAGVSRATIYKTIGSRRELLAAVFEDQGRLINYQRVRDAQQHPDPYHAVISTVRNAAQAWSEIPGPIRKVLALAVLDPEIGELVSKYERYRREEVAALALRAHGAGVFGASITLRNATSTLVLLTGFATFDALQSDVGPAAAIEQLARIARSGLAMAVIE